MLVAADSDRGHTVDRDELDFIEYVPGTMLNERDLAGKALRLRVAP